MKVTGENRESKRECTENGGVGCDRSICPFETPFYIPPLEEA